MTDRLQSLRSLILSGGHHALRRDAEADTAVYRDASLPLHRRTALRTKTMLDAQSPAFLPGERIAFLRTSPDLPPVLSEEELAEIRKDHYIHEQGRVCNLAPCYAPVIARGLRGVIDDLADAAARFPERAGQAESAILSIRALLDLVGRYRAEAEKQGLTEIAALLSRVPAYPASTYHEALQSFRILHFALWCEGDYHNTVGRIDQYLYPYYAADLAAGRLTREEALELTEEFFLSFNRDSDLYFGMQQGDNGQSLVLGGCTKDGRDGYNDLSKLCLEAAMEMRTIDPKINLRVNGETPLERYEFASQLTALGMGFPQYANDDVVTAGLRDLGYAPEDAADYVVAACWEFIVPGKGMDIPNIGALCLPECVDIALRESADADFDAFRAHTAGVIRRECRRIAEEEKDLFLCPAPYMSIFFEGCAATARDISEGCVYNNYGIHGTGLGNGADYLTSVRAMIYEGGMTREDFLAMLDNDFRGYEEQESAIARLPKFGSDEARSNENAAFLLNAFSDAVRPLRNERGGRYRAGTGSAMYYAFHGNVLGATGDGRHRGDYLPANYSPSLGVKTGGPLNVVRAFSSPDLRGVINGGPLTLELSQTIVGLPEKVAPVVQAFIRRGGHQLQLNAVDRRKLLDAEEHPEAHRELVVRVWGWSGYYTQLDEVYRRQILARTEYNM